MKYGKHLIVSTLFFILVFWNFPLGSANEINFNTGGFEKKMWSNDELCEFINGCLIEGKICYSFGHVDEEKYCGFDESHYSKFRIKRNSFINQSEDGENCSYDFQCQSNFCFKNQCVREVSSLIKEITLEISNLENEINVINNDLVFLRSPNGSCEDIKEPIPNIFKMIFGY